MDVTEHVPITGEQWGLPAPNRSLWCKRCGFLLVRSDGKQMPRMDKPCNPASIDLRAAL